MVNNMAVIDPMPNPRYSEVSEFEKDLIKKYLSKTLKKDLKDDIKIELVNSNLVGEDFKVKVDEDGKDVLRKGLKEEQFVMIGLKTLQETIIKMEALEARIKKLEDG